MLFIVKLILIFLISDRSIAMSTSSKLKEKPVPRKINLVGMEIEEKSLINIAISPPEININSKRKHQMTQLALKEISKYKQLKLIFGNHQVLQSLNTPIYKLYMTGKTTSWGDGKHGFNLNFYILDLSSDKKQISLEKKKVLIENLLYESVVILEKIIGPNTTFESKND